MRNPQPISPRKQLSAYYKAQGFTGQRARKAVRDDMRRVRELFRRSSSAYIAIVGFERAWYNCAHMGIAGLFMLSESREGFDYWYDRARSLGGL